MDSNSSRSPPPPRSYPSRPSLAETLLFNTTKGRDGWRLNLIGCRELASAVRLVPEKPTHGGRLLMVRSTPQMRPRTPGGSRRFAALWLRTVLHDHLACMPMV